jgi:dipeptidase
VRSRRRAGHLSDLRDEPLHWVTGTSAPCTSVFHPVRVDQPIDDRAVSGADPTNRYDAVSRWWRHERFHRLVLRDHAASLGRFVAARDALERRWLEHPPATADAFAESASAEASWLADLVAADLAETRPGWLSSLWQELDESAGLDVDDVAD